MAESPSPQDKNGEFSTAKNRPSRDKSGVPPADGKPPRDFRRELLQYAGWSTQVCLAVGVSVFAGIKSDKWLRTSFPIFSWVLPLLVIVALIVKLIKETSGNGGRH